MDGNFEAATIRTIGFTGFTYHNHLEQENVGLNAPAHERKLIFHLKLKHGDEGLALL